MKIHVCKVRIKYPELHIRRQQDTMRAKPMAAVVDVWPGHLRHSIVRTFISLVKELFAYAPLLTYNSANDASDPSPYCAWQADEYLATFKVY